MGKAIIGIVALIVGFVGGAVLGGGALTGMAAGAGIATGLSAGICATVTAAQEEGLLDDAQIAQVLARAATDMGGELPADADLISSREQCADVMERLRAAANG